ncbi:MAG: hypothetical protein KTR20_06990 [Cellvibrionaceae bacterium]|nr:hypothetical protein [Cellvibrionaceae bacterium]
MTHTDLLNKTCLIGISYFDTQGELLRQQQHAGTVVEVDHEEGISVKLQAVPGITDPPVVHLPPALDAWFIATPGHYRNAECPIDIKNPHYLVTWDVYKTKEDTPEGKHEWWEWVPRTTPPQVGLA